MNTAGFWSSDQTLFMFLPHLAKRRFHKFDVCISTLPPPTPLTPSSQPPHLPTRFPHTRAITPMPLTTSRWEIPTGMLCPPALSHLTHVPWGCWQNCYWRWEPRTHHVPEGLRHSWWFPSASTRVHPQGCDKANM